MIYLLGNIVYDDKNLQIELPTKIYQEAARLFCQQSEMRSFIWKSRLYEIQMFQNEWNKAELLYILQID